MTQLSIVANIICKQGKQALVKEQLLKLIDTTRAETGCINYDLHQDQQQDNHFMFYENWESRELWQDHMNKQHLKDYNEATQGCIEQFTLNEMSIIG